MQKTRHMREDSGVETFTTKKSRSPLGPRKNANFSRESSAKFAKRSPNYNSSLLKVDASQSPRLSGVKLMNPKLRDAFKNFELGKAEIIKHSLVSQRPPNSGFKENFQELSPKKLAETSLFTKSFLARN